jgi:hypothetical protein
MAKVKAGLTDITAIALVAKAQSVHDGIVGNPAVFAGPKPSAVEVQGLIDELVAANAAVSGNNGPKEVRTRKNAARAVADALRQWSGYVQMVSAGDAHIIRASNFEVVERGSRIGEVSPPDVLKSRLTRHLGRVSLAWKRKHGTRMHHVWMSTSNNPFNWERVGNSRRITFNMDGLTPGTFYWFAVSSIGTAGESSKSEPCLAMAAA